MKIAIAIISAFALSSVTVAKASPFQPIQGASVSAKSKGGTYAGGKGSSHKGGSYVSPKGKRYSK